MMKTLFVILAVIVLDSAGFAINSNSKDEPTQSWAYVTVRPKAHMFYWLYETTHSSGYENRPLILWLQGGPGGSGTGFGNFQELGPLDVNLKPRNTTWLQTASLLFIDNPVGTGYSYVEEGGTYTKNVAEISADLLTCMKAFTKKNKQFQKVPFYIFSESYGGKMTAAFSAVLYKAVKAGEIELNFKGFAMGDSWISPVDSVKSWGPYLYATSLVDKSGLEKLQKEAGKVEQLVKEGELPRATSEWSHMEDVVSEVSGGVNFYNIMQWNSAGLISSEMSPIEKLFQRHVGVHYGGDLATLMNGVIRKKLQIIPDSVRWGAQAGSVFSHMTEDFMTNVTSTVNDLINNTPLTVVTYEGQLDLICDVLGGEAWFYTLDVAAEFKRQSRKQYSCTGKSVCYYGQSYKNAQFYWILDAGHMVPSDNGYAALSMVNRIIGK